MLALAVGEVDVEAMLRRLTAKQFLGWQHYYDLEPFGEVRADIRTASIVQMIYNVNRSTKEKARPLKDFIIKFEEEEKKQLPTWQAMAKTARMIAEIYNAPGINA